MCLKCEALYCTNAVNFPPDTTVPVVVVKLNVPVRFGERAVTVIEPVADDSMELEDIYTWPKKSLYDPVVVEREYVPTP